MNTLAVFVDLKGAYDQVWRTKLIWKLQQLGVNSRMIQWFKSFLSQRWIATKHEDCLAPYIQTKVGLPQGAVTSKTLFNMYINDLPATLKKVNNINCAMFTDDIVI